MWKTVAIFSGFALGLLLGAKVLADERQLIFLDDSPIFEPTSGLHVFIEVFNISPDGDVCVAHNEVRDGTAETDDQGFGKVAVRHEEKNEIEWMEIGDFFDFAIAICTNEAAVPVASNAFYASLH